MDITIKKFARADTEAVMELLREFAEYEDLLQFLELTEERVERAFFADGSVAEGLVAMADGKAVGYAFFFPNFASFRGQRGLYLEDIYITASYRRYGIGEKMLREIARLAASRGYERIDFLVLDWNESAINFYKKLGAEMDQSERHFRFINDAFKALAA
ncbi:MAG: GNAT family N-acetyltransferase [Acidobacteria bacterium]|nr:GNAT family N-acetyltransferase [Acidobacteriota bacterium]